MSRASFFFRLGVLIVAIAIGYPLLFSPLATPLPGSTQELQLPKLRKALDKLTLEERGLVERYVARSRGTVLPPRFADPEAPLTARTFGEAIKLQRELEARFAKDQAVRDAQRKLREEQFAPLREVLSVELLSREIVGRAEFLHRGQPPSESEGPKLGIVDTARVLITTYRVRNRTAEPITRYSGWVTVRTTDDPSSSRGIASCSLEESRWIEPGEESDVHCGNLHTQATEADEQYAALPRDALLLTWEPQEITFASGRKLTGPQADR